MVDCRHRSGAFWRCFANISTASFAVVVCVVSFANADRVTRRASDAAWLYNLGTAYVSMTQNAPITVTLPVSLTVTGVMFQYINGSGTAKSGTWSEGKWVTPKDRSPPCILITRSHGFWCQTGGLSACESRRAVTQCAARLQGAVFTPSKASIS
jgi:hypothetical protein